MGNSYSDQVKDSEKLEVATQAFNNSSFADHINELKESFEGEVLAPSDVESYTKARTRPWNMDQRNYPLVIVRPKNTSDVVKAVNFKRQYGDSISLCIASGCHSSKCMVSGTFVIDLGAMTNTSYDPATQTITVDGGCYLKAIDDALQPINRAVPVGTYPFTGVGGLVLGGGYGWLTRKFGQSVDHLIAAEVVLASGEVVFADETNEYRDLLWGLRGGGGNFGVVTKFVFSTVELPPHCIAGSVVYLAPTIAAAKTIVQKFDQMVCTLPAECTAAFVLPAGAPVVPIMFKYLGDKSKASDVPEIKQITSIGGGWGKLANTIKPVSFHKDVQTMTSPEIKSGYIYHTVMPFGRVEDPLPEEYLDRILTAVRAPLAKGVDKAVVVFFAFGTAPGDIPRDADNVKTCLPVVLRHVKYFAIIEAHFSPQLGSIAKDNARAWAQNIFNILKPLKTLNNVAGYAADSITALQSAVEEEEVKYIENPIEVLGFGSLQERLRAVKIKYDRENFFHMNMNIAPNAVASAAEEEKKV